jgi:hypothetical protein
MFPINPTPKFYPLSPLIVKWLHQVFATVRSFRQGFHQAGNPDSELPNGGSAESTWQPTGCCLPLNPRVETRDAECPVGQRSRHLQFPDGPRAVFVRHLIDVSIPRGGLGGSGKVILPIAIAEEL